MSENQIQEMQDKILKGLSLAFERLVEKKKREDQEFVFADKDGKIVHIRARDMK